MTDPFVDQLLSAGRRDRASAESRARALALVGAGAAAGVAVGATRSATTLTTGAKITLVVAALAGGALVATRAREKPATVSPVAKPTVTPTIDATTAVSAPVVVSIASAAETPSAASPPVPKKVFVAAAPSPAPSAKPARIDDPAAELALVSAAHAELQSGDPQGALTQLATWRERYKGVYAEEAEAIEVDALVATGAKERAAKSAARFVERWPQSPHAARMRALTIQP